MTEAVEIYVPKPGSMPWLVLTFLVAHPDAVLMRKDAAAIADCPINSVDAILQLAVVRGGLMKIRNDQLEVTWRLGDKKAFRLDKCETGVKLLEPPPPAGVTLHPAAALEHIQNLADHRAAEQKVEPEPEPQRVKRPYTRRVRAGTDQRPETQIGEPWAKSWPGEPVGSGEILGLNPPETVQNRDGAKLVLRVQKIVGICPFKDTMVVASEDGVFMYDNVTNVFRPIPFAAK